jgi:hypothetical protein
MFAWIKSSMADASLIDRNSTVSSAWRATNDDDEQYCFAAFDAPAQLGGIDQLAKR